MIFTPTKRSWRLAPEKGAVIIGFALYIFVAFVAVLYSQSGLEPNYAVPLVIATLPVFAFLAFRLPMIFPFGLYVALVPFDSLLSVSGGGATIARFVAIATAAAMIFHALLLRRAFVPHRAWALWAAVSVYIAGSLLWTSDPANGLLVTVSVIDLFLFMTVLAMYPATKTEFRVALGIVVACGVLAAGYAVQAYVTGNVSSDTVASSRVQITLGNNIVLDYNYFAASFILPIAIATSFTFYGKRLVVRIVSAVADLILMSGLLLTGSRGAFLASVAIFIYFAIRSKYRLQVIGFAGVVGAVTLFFPSVYVRFAHDPSDQGSGSGRTFIWQTGLHSLRDHLFFGTGAGSYANTYDRNFLNVYQGAFQGWSRPSHSILVGGITELGIVGLILVLAAWYTSFRQLRVIPKTSEWFGLRVAFEGAILALFAMSLSIDPTYVKYIWLAHSLALMLVNQVVPRALRLERSPVPSGARMARAG